MGKAWYRANREKAKAYNREWRKKNPSKAAEYSRERRRKDPESVRQRQRYWRAAHKDKYNASSRRAREKNPEKSKAAIRDWAKRHVEEIRMKCRKRRARIANAKGTFTLQEWSTLKLLYGNKCLCCSRTEQELHNAGLVLSPDHVVPLCKGGSNYIANIQPLCHARHKGITGGCNEKKGTKTIDYRRKHVQA